MSPQLHSPAVPCISCAREAGGRCQGALHPPPPQPKGGAQSSHLAPAPRPAGCPAVSPAGPCLGRALPGWLPGVSGPVRGPGGTGPGVLVDCSRAERGAVGASVYMGDPGAPRSLFELQGVSARVTACSCVFSPMMFGGPGALGGAELCVWSTCVTPPHRRSCACVCTATLALDVCMRPRECAWSTHVCGVHACLQQCVWVWNVRGV